MLQIASGSYNLAWNVIDCDYKMSASQLLRPSLHVLSQNTYRIIDRLLSYPQAFGWRIIPAIALTAHRRLYAKASEFGLIDFATILAATITVEH